MKTIRLSIFRAFLLIAFMTAYLCLLYGQERGHVVPIARNTAWNDLVIQVNPDMGDSSSDSLGKELLYRAIDQVHARFQKADKDLETIKNELSYKEAQAKLGR